jgi:predicted kinase
VSARCASLDAVTATRIVLMGVAGSGKTTIGRMVAARLGAPFVDADDLHSAAAKAQMHGGHPLDDAERAPWLARVRAAVAAVGDGAVVLACSALKHEYRDALRDGVPTLTFVDLDVDADTLARRLRGVAVQSFTLPFGPRRARATGGPPGSMTPQQADRAGAIELLDLGAQQLFATNASTPVTLRLQGRRTGLSVTPLGADGERGRPRFYGPLSGTLTIEAGADAKIRTGGKLVAPLRRADRRPPRTRVRVRLHGGRAILRVRATDRSGVAVTFATVGDRPTKRVRRILRVRRADLKRVRFQSVDAFGNVEPPRRAPLAART